MLEEQYPERLARLRLFESKEEAAQWLAANRKENSSAEGDSKKDFEAGSNDEEGGPPDATA